MLQWVISTPERWVISTPAAEEQQLQELHLNSKSAVPHTVCCPPCHLPTTQTGCSSDFHACYTRLIADLQPLLLVLVDQKNPSKRRVNERINAPISQKTAL
jgi:hypothetical protein